MDRVEPPTLKRGVVGSVAFNVASRDLIYEVAREDGVSEEPVVDLVPEKRLAYSAACPVSITEPGGGGVARGTVLCCRPAEDPGKVTYTVMIAEGSTARYETDVEGGRLKYCALVEGEGDAADERCGGGRQRPRDATGKSDGSRGSRSRPAAANTTPKSAGRGAAPAVRRDGGAPVEREIQQTRGEARVPSSITCRVAKTPTFEEEASTGSQIVGPRVPAAKTASESAAGDATTIAAARKRGREGPPVPADAVSGQAKRSPRTAAGGSQDRRASPGTAGSLPDPVCPVGGTLMVMSVPAWLQKTRRMQKNLLCELARVPIRMVFLNEDDVQVHCLGLERVQHLSRSRLNTVGHRREPKLWKQWEIAPLSNCVVCVMLHL